VSPPKWPDSGAQPASVMRRRRAADENSAPAMARVGVSRETIPRHARASTPQPGPPEVAAEAVVDSGGTPIADEAERATRVKHPTERRPRPDQRRVLAVANQKGGVGKTTSTVNLAAGLALQGLRTLVVDLDPQGNASTALGVEHRAGTQSVYEVLLGELGIADA